MNCFQTPRQPFAATPLILEGNYSLIRFFRRRVFIFLVLGAIVAAFFLCAPPETVSAAPQNDAVGQLNENVKENLGNIDFGDLDEIANSLGDADFNLFKSDSFGSKVGKILSGEFASDYPNLLAAILGLLGGFIFDVLPVIVLIVAIACLSGFMNSIKSESQQGVGNIIHFVCYAAIIVIVLGAVMSLSAEVGGVLGSLKAQMDIIFPILLTLMTAIGSVASVGVYQPAVVMLSSGVMQIFSFVVMPLFFTTLVFSVVGNLSGATRLDKFVAFFTSAFKWIVGIVFTVFLAFLTIQGITAGAHDGVSIRAAKLTISSYVPFLGGYISQGFDLVMASSILIKNAVGVAGLYLLLGVVLGPVIKIAVFILALKLAAAVTQPIADARISNFLTSVNKALGMLVAVLIGAAFMYFLTVGLVIISGNVI